MTSNTLDVSIVIPNLNSPVIDRVLAAIRNQTFPLERVEVLVVGRDEPGLVADAVALRRPTVRFLDSLVPTPPARARNLGLAVSRGQIVVFLDADCVPEREWLARLLAPYTQRGADVVGGSMALFGSDRWALADNVATFHEYLGTRPAGERDLLPTFSLSCRRAVLETTGGFDEAYPYPAGEDADLTLRMRLAGYRLLFEPAAVVYHYPSRRSLDRLLRHAYRFGRYSVKVDPRYAAGLAVPWSLRRAWRTYLAAPLLAGGVTWQAFCRDRSLWRHWSLAPLVFGAKLAWCAGAAHTLRCGAPALGDWGQVYRLPGGQEPGQESSGAVHRARSPHPLRRELRQGCR